jgi:uncharacterized RDD family membrane protein YckC
MFFRDGRMEATGQNMQIDLGHWLLRLIAFIIDSVILGIIAFILVLFLVVPFLFVGAFAGFYAAWGYVLVVPFAIGILSVLYFLVLEVSWGGTIGKRILGLQVQTVKGGRTTYSQSFIRNISKIFWVFLLLDWLIGVLTPGDKRQKYSDRMAGTIVVQASQAFASITPPPQTPSQ